MDLLGAIAFKMMAATPGPVMEIDHDIEGFQKDVARRVSQTGAWDFEERDETLTGLCRDFEILRAMDSHHFIFVTGARDQKLRWTDPTTRAFFAAYWACRWANDEHRQIMRKWVIDPLNATNEVFREFWMFAAEMPDEVDALDHARWVELFRPLYDRSVRDEMGHPIRSTEFIYRSWDRMSQWDGQIVDDFRREFDSIRTGKRDRERERQQLARELLAGFIPLCEGNLDGDTGSFTMGAPADEDPEWDTRFKGSKQVNPQHEVRLSEYRLHRYCVTNLEYELFDPRHRDRRWFGGKHPDVEQTNEEQADDRCPVVMVSWYDAWCFAKWLGPVTTPVDGRDREFEIVLPSEAQWEYACRAKRHTPFTFGEGDDGTTCHPELCNFNGNYPFPSNAPIDKDENRRYRERTIPVNAKTNGGQVIDRIGPNRWGFYQMHGNVWEWCEDWYSAGFYDSHVRKEPDPVNVALASARVLRGGSWIGNGRGCRSAYRYGDGPSNRHGGNGFRLAAVPGAKPGR